VPFASGASFRQPAEVPRLNNVQWHRFGEDLAVEAYLRDPYAD